MPALVNIKVGSLRGTSGDDASTVWSLRAKKSRKLLRRSLTPPMNESRSCPLQSVGGKAKSPPGLMFRRLFSDGGQLCPGTVSYTHLRAHATRHDLVCR